MCGIAVADALGQTYGMAELVQRDAKQVEAPAGGSRSIISYFENLRRLSVQSLTPFRRVQAMPADVPLISHLIALL